ncbi:MAG: malonyl CoA-acyl carrier protein transacylase [marine bacterium B5-7]|nr:MAG: malonyl CoA-acyl carrier protein transacylase [marine bacterium B5-7]
MPDQPNQLFLLFPGQGSQYPGIGKDLCENEPAARKVYQTASDVLGYDIERLSFYDPDEQIHLTRYTQPVLLTHSIACLRAFEQRIGKPLRAGAVAGHSLGEYSALVAAGALDFADALNLVAIRGELMSTHGQGEMEALPVSIDDAKPFADRFFCAIAACNLPDQTVVGGASEDLDRLAQEFTVANPRKRTARLKTEGAFHTYYMVGAAREFREHLDAAPFRTPHSRVLSNYTGDFHDDTAEAIRTRLFFQLFHPVLWHQNLLEGVAAGATHILEFGGGIGRGESAEDKRPNLEGIVKKTFRRADQPPAYGAVINSATLDASADNFG